MPKFVNLFSLISLVMLASCSLLGGGKMLQRVDYSALGGWEESDLSNFRISFEQSCKKLLALKVKNNLQSEQSIICSEYNSKTLHNTRFREFLEKHFMPYRIYDSENSEGLLTGYYLIKLQGSKTASSRFRYPIYEYPENKNILDATRIEIEDLRSKLSLKPLLFVEDKARLFFLHVQGSGIVELENGEQIYVTYAGKNNQKYTSIGKYFLDNNIFSRDEISAPKIMSWLRRNKGQKADEIMNLNASFVFFKLADNEIKGAADVPLTPRASLAIDKAIYPMHTPFWVETTYPDESEEDMNFLGISQDTGSAIKGKIRADIFFGKGQWAENIAGSMKQEGEMFILLPQRIHPSSYF